MYVLDSDVLTIISGSRQFQKRYRMVRGNRRNSYLSSVFAIAEKSRGATTAAREAMLKCRPR